MNRTAICSSIGSCSQHASHLLNMPQHTAFWYQAAWPNWQKWQARKEQPTATFCLKVDIEEALGTVVVTGGILTRTRRTLLGRAESGQLEVLQWAHAHSCPGNEWTCASAAQGGHLEVLQWACANGCPWDNVTSYNTSLMGRDEVLDWVTLHGCPRT